MESKRGSDYTGLTAAEAEHRLGKYGKNTLEQRRFILPQAGTGGYGIRPYVFEAAEHQPSRGVTAGGGL